MERRSYIPCLDGIRACAFLLVFIGHAGYEKLVPGGLGVTVFFFLSGYLITTLLRIEAEDTGQVSLRQFYIRRAFRILPPLYITLFLAFVVDSLCFREPAGNRLGWLSSVVWLYNYAELLSHDHARLPAGMGLIWTLAIEEHFYLIFPLLYKGSISRAWSRHRQSLTLVGVCAAVLIWRCVLVFYFKTPLVPYVRWTYIATDARLDSIAFGCLLAVAHNPWCNDVGGWLQRRAGIFASLGCALILLSLIVREPHLRETVRYSLQGVALYPIFYFCVLQTNSAWVRWLSWSPLRWIGWISYSLYLCHEVVLGVLGHILPLRKPVLAIVSLAVSILFAWIMRALVETPLRKLRSRKLNLNAA